MSDDARELLRTINSDHQLTLFGARLHHWILSASAAGAEEAPPDYPESRARALLRAAGGVDETMLADFNRVMAAPNGLRLAMYDLLAQTGLAEDDETRALAAIAGRAPQAEPAKLDWLSLVVSSHAWKRGYPLAHLDPASPPERFSPAGQVVANSAAFLRQQIQRSATDRDRLARLLAPRAPGEAASLDQLDGGGTIAPLPPHFRPPIPVRYPEVARETLHVEPDSQATEPAPAVRRGDALVITESDLRGEAPQQPAEQSPPGDAPAAPVRMPPLRISRDQLQPPSQPPSPLPPSAVVMPSNNAEGRPGLTMSIRQMFGSESLATTKLRVLAQKYPDGPGLYGLQVKVSCKGIKSFVAGATDREGRFVAELPVKMQEGLTYDVDLTWPRELGGEVERKSMTLHADRTEFILPFYYRLEPDEDAGATPPADASG